MRVSGMFERFMIASEMDPISIGCWEVTGSYKGHELTYVFEVEPQLVVRPRPSDAGDGALVTTRWVDFLVAGFYAILAVTVSWAVVAVLVWAALSVVGIV